MTDSYVPTLNADGDIQNVATQQSERGGATIETQEFALTAAQLATLTPPANPDPSTETKQDDLITAIGTLQTTVEALTTAVGLLAKLTDTQPVNTNWSKVSTLNSASGTHVGSSDGGTAIWTGAWEEIADYGNSLISLYVPDASLMYIYIEHSNDGATALSNHTDMLSPGETNNCIVDVQTKARYFRVYFQAAISDEGSGNHAYKIETIFRKHAPVVYPYGFNTAGVSAGLFFDGDTGGLAVSLSQPDKDLLQTIIDNTGA